MPSAPTRTAAHLLVALNLLILSSTICTAQGRRVFPLITDTLAVEMPDAFKIEAADSYGANAYAVWGTWGITPEGDTVCRLVGQLIDGSTPVGEPVVIHSDAARPGNAVSVIALPTGFVVLWNDYRRVDSGEIYARVVRLSGGFTMPEEHLFADGAMKGSVETYGDAAIGQVLRWTSVDGRTNLITIDNATRIVQPLRREDGEVLTQYYDGGILPDHTVLKLPNGRMIVIDERNARVLDDPPTYSRVFGHHHIDAAGRFSIIRGDTLLTYASIYDSIPLRSTILNDLDSIAGGIVFIAGNNLGGVSAFYAKVMRDDIRSEYAVKGQMGTFWLALFEQKLDSSGVNQGTSSIRSFLEIEGNYPYNDRFFRFYRFENAGTSFTCGGGIHVYYQIRSKYIEWGGSDAIEEIKTLPLLCATVGPDGGRTGTYGCTSSGGSTDCIVQRVSGLVVSRLRSDSLSRVTVDLGDTNLVLEQKGDVIPQPYIPTIRWLPQGMVYGGRAFILFSTPSSLELVKLDETSKLFPLGEFRDKSLETNWRHFNLRTEDMKQRYFRYENRQHVEPHRPGTYLSSLSTWVTETYYVNGIYGLFAARNIFAYPGATGWGTIIDGAIQWTSYSPVDIIYTEAPFPSIAWDPNSSSTMVRYLYQLAEGGPWQAAASLDDFGNVKGVVTWSGSDNIYETMFPEHIGSYLGVRQGRLYRVDTTGIGYLGTLPAGPPSSAYTAWFGNDFIRYAAPDSSHLTIELMTTAPRALRKRTIEIAGPNNTFTFITNRGDSSLTVLWSDSLGINDITLSKDFSRQIPRRRLVEKPGVLTFTGVFQDDSLHVVWDDARDGVRTLYRLGVAVVPPDDPIWMPMAKGGDILSSVEYDENGEVIGGDTTTVGIANEAFEEIDSRSNPFVSGDRVTSSLISHFTDVVPLYPIPNPASTSIELRIRLTQPWPVTITLADESGRVVQRHDALPSTTGENRFTLDIEKLIPGAYTVVLQAGDGRGEGRVVVTPR